MNTETLKSYFYLALNLVAAVFFEYKGWINWESPFLLIPIVAIPITAVIYFTIAKSVKEV